MERTCEDCVFSQDCKERKRDCRKHVGVMERALNVFRQAEWDRFCEEWNRSRELVRVRFGYDRSKNDET